MSKGKRSFWRKFVRITTIAIGIFIVILAVFGAIEAKYSYFQSYIFHRIAEKASFEPVPGQNPNIKFPAFGPSDKRLGYTEMPKMIARLHNNYGMDIKTQAAWSPTFSKIAAKGYYPPYNEATSHGLTVLDKDGKEIWSGKWPVYTFATYDEIPRLVLDTLYFIEDRELPTGTKYKNPVVDAERLISAIWKKIMRRKVHGASTLATQIVKYQHSDNGRTDSIKEKFRQMASASLRAYSRGRETAEVRRKIALDYINSVPLGAVNGYGEVLGLGDGLSAWFGTDPEEAKTILANCNRDLPACGRVYRQVLALFLAQRRPSYYLGKSKDQLEHLADSHLRILAKQKIINWKLFVAAAKAKLTFRESVGRPAPNWLKAKLQNAVKTNLLALLNIPEIYALERLDLTARSYLDKAANDALADKLRKITAGADKTLVGHYLLGKTGENDLLYSFTLYESLGNVNAIRVETDLFPSAFNLNEGMKMELGSTAKFRTLVSYLEITAEVYNRLVKLNETELKAIKPHKKDEMTQWVKEWLLKHPGGSRKEITEAAMERKFSSGSGESFFTGGGLHHFSNFNGSDNIGMASVRIGLQRSINLVYVRIMRDIINHFTYEDGERTDDILGNPASLLRKQYIDRFVDEEAKLFLFRFYQKYKALPDKNYFGELLKEIEKKQVGGLIKAKYLSAAYRVVHPGASFEEYSKFMADRAPVPEKKLQMFYEVFDPKKMHMQDFGASCRRHPLELWVVRYLTHAKKPTFDELYGTSGKARRESYIWLYKPSKFAGQTKRISVMLEIDAFKKLEPYWQRVGFPFRLVPSYATAIGSSGDRPAALAKLMGIIVNGGLMCPAKKIEELHFAKGTPYETVIGQRPDQCKKVLDADIAAIVKKTLSEVVEFGTAIRLKSTFITKTCRFPIGGKTGTGDNRLKHKYDKRILNRTATFVFFVGDRFFGVITVFVPGDKAAKYHFTSSLPVQTLKNIWPILKPMVGGCD